MNLYRAVGLQELGSIYDSGMKAFPAGLPQQPIFYPVLQIEYARQVALDWNVRNGEFAGYVTKFTVDDQYISRFDEHAVGDSPYREFWIPADELDEFNKHIVSHIKTVEAHFGEAFQGFIPETFGLQGKNAIEQFTLLTTTYIYKRMDFYLEIRRNHKAVYLNYPFWQKYDFKNRALKEKLLKAIKEAWLTSFPKIPLVNAVRDDLPLEVQPDLPSQDETSQEDITLLAQAEPNSLNSSDRQEVHSVEKTDSQPLAYPVQEDRAPIKKPDTNSLVKSVHEQANLVKQPVSHFERGVKLGLSGYYREAVDELTRAVEEESNDATIHTSLGVAYRRLGSNERALSCYETALKLSPGNADAHYFRANILYSLGDVREALAEYTIAMGLQPELIDAHQKNPVQDRLTEYISSPAEMYWIAKSAHHILALNRLLEINPEQADLLKERAAEYYRLWNYEQAVADYSLFLAIQPEDANVLHARGVAYEQIGQHNLALHDYQRAIGINPQLVDVYVNRGIAFAKMGNYRQAIASLTEGIRLAPENPDIYFNRGMSYYQYGDWGNAIDDFSNAIQFSSGDEEAYYWRGVSNEEVGRQQDAIADYMKFLELSQNSQAREEVEQRLKQWNVKKQIGASSQNAIPNDVQQTSQVEVDGSDRNLDFYDLISALGERAFHSIWFGSGVGCSGETAEELSLLADQNLPVQGRDLLRIAIKIRHMAEGEFIAFDPGSDSHWILIRVWGESGFYIEINDPKSRERLKTSFQFVEEVNGAVHPYESLFVHI